MKKLISIPVFFLLFVSCTGVNKEKKDKAKNAEVKKEETNGGAKIRTLWTKMNLKGKVRSILNIYFQYTEVIKSGRSQIQEGELIGYPDSTIFDDKGNFLRGKGEYEGRKTTSKYDNNGNEIEENVYDSEIGGTLWLRNAFKYDDMGNLIEKNKYTREGHLSERNTFKNDEKGNPIEMNEYLGDESFFRKFTYKHDNNDNITEEICYSKDGSLESKKTYKYDDNNNITEENWYLSDGTLDGKETYKYEYDKNLNWVRKIVSGDTHAIIKRIIVYY